MINFAILDQNLTFGCLSNVSIALVVTSVPFKLLFWTLFVVSTSIVADVVTNGEYVIVGVSGNTEF